MEETSGKCRSDILTECDREIAHDGGIIDLLGSTSSHAVLDARGQVPGQMRASANDYIPKPGSIRVQSALLLL